VAAELLWPQQTGSVALYALVGMASMIAGTTHATISSILLIFEVTNDYAMILPVMLASATAVVLSSALNRESIYTLKLVRAGIHLKRGVEVNIMGSIPVRQVMRPPDQVVNENTHFNTLIDTIVDSRSNTFPVVDDEGILRGVITYGDVRALLAEERSPEMDLLIVAGDIATPRPEVVTPEENLNDAMRTFGMQDLAVLPVVDSRDTMRLVGKLHRIDVLNAYRRALMTSG
jgi:CIC family chloride channel protein